MIVEGLRDLGVNVDHLQRRSQGATARSVIVILVEVSSGRRSILDDPDSVASPTTAELPHDLIATARVLHLAGFHTERQGFRLLPTMLAPVIPSP